MLRDGTELANTREKLRDLESRYAELQNESSYDERVRRLTSRSLERLIIQLKEEITRYEAHQPGPQAELTNAEIQAEVDAVRRQRRQERRRAAGD